MRFCTWMKKQYLHENSPKGKLARDIKSDGRNFPAEGRYSKVRKYLIVRNADEHCLQVFEECWEEYTACEKKRLNAN